MSYVNGVCCGVTIRGWVDEEFGSYLWPIDFELGGAALSLDVEYFAAPVMPEVEEFWKSESACSEPISRLSLYHQGGAIGLKVECQGRGVFRIDTSSVRIEWLPGGTGPAHYFFSCALPIWLEMKGITVLHGSAVSLGGRAVAFLGPSGAGKSTIAEFLGKLGAEFVAEDGLAITEGEEGEWFTFPGPPLYRLWPSSPAFRTGYEASRLSKVHSDYEKRVLPLREEIRKRGPREYRLAGIYVLERDKGLDSDVRLVPSTGAIACLSLIEYSLVYGPMVALGWAGSRFKRISRLAREVSVKRLVYPNGRKNLDHVMDVVLNDIDRQK